MSKNENKHWNIILLRVMILLNSLKKKNSCIAFLEIMSPCGKMCVATDWSLGRCHKTLNIFWNTVNPNSENRLMCLGSEFWHREAKTWAVVTASHLSTNSSFGCSTSNPAPCKRNKKWSKYLSLYTHLGILRRNSGPSCGPNQHQKLQQSYECLLFASCNFWSK